MTPPETPDDAPSDPADQGYERIFAELFTRFWRGTRAEAPPEADGLDPDSEDRPSTRTDPR